MSQRTPQPGAQQGTTHLPFSPAKATTLPACPDLAASDAINFDNTSPVRLSAGTVLWRVFGGSAYDTGSYWSAAPPTQTTTEAEWRSAEAVALSWNDGRQLCSLTVESKGLFAWKGEVAAQPAQDMQGKYLPGFMLPGGGGQLKVIYPPNTNHKRSMPGYFSIADQGSTPWAKQSTLSQSAPQAAGPTGSLAGTGFSALSAALSDLTAALANGKLDGSELDRAERVHQTQAKLLRSQHCDLERAVFEDTAESQRTVRHLLHSFRGLQRHILLDHNPTANATLQKVILAAHERL